MVRWLVTDADSDAVSERNCVSCRCSCGRFVVALCATMFFVRCTALCAAWSVSPRAGV